MSIPFGLSGCSYMLELRSRRNMETVCPMLKMEQIAALIFVSRYLGWLEYLEVIGKVDLEEHIGWCFHKCTNEKTLMESVVRIEFVREALQWLADFNCNYDDVDVSTQLINSVIMIDNSEDVQEVDSKVESVYEFTGKTLDENTDVLRMEQLIFLC